jgi:hypothetical protein
MPVGIVLGIGCAPILIKRATSLFQLSRPE